jgi:hypothetical protein
MKQYQDLDITGDPDALAAFIDELNAAVASPWSSEKAQSTSLLGKGTKAYLFVRSPQGGIPEVTVTFYHTGDRCNVPNIVPSEGDRLSHDQYNSILQDFARIAKPIAAKHGVDVNIGDTRFKITDHISPDAVEQLDGFSHAANKSTGSSHPSDHKRWCDFIIQTHRDQTDAAGVLGRYLVEELGWSDERAHELVIEYEQGYALLDRFDPQ